MAGLSEDLLRRAKARAADPDRRNDAPPSLHGRMILTTGGGFDAVTPGDLLAGRLASPPAADPGLAAPVSAKRLANVEARLGRALPEGLRRLYLEVADGGFGRGEGLMPLDRLTKTYLRYLGKTPGRRGQIWPPALLPLTPADPGHDCLDLESGAVVYWDPEEIAYGGGSKAWARCFKPAADGLAAWLERWLDSPSAAERLQARMAQSKREGIERALAWWGAKTPAERAELGLPETGWEERLRADLEGR